MYLNRKNKKFRATFLLIVFLFVFSFNFLGTPKKANAQFTDAANLAVNTGRWIWDKIQSAFNFTYKNIVSVAFKKGLQSYMNSLAQQAAKSVVAGGSGQKPLWTTEGWADFNKKAMDSAGAQFIDGISKGIAGSTGIIIDVCEPPSGLNLKLKLQLKLSKTSTKSLSQPKCSLSSMKEKWGKFADTLMNNPAALVKLNGKSLAQLTGDNSDYAAYNFVKNMVTVKESDVQYVNITELSLAEFKEEAKKIAQLNRVNPDSPKPKTAVVTGQVKTPAQIQAENLAAIRAENKKVAQISTGSIVADSANIFLNTLVSEGLNKLVQNLFKALNPQTQYSDNGGNNDNNKNKLGPLDTIDRIFTSIGNIAYNLTAKDVDVITELETDLGDDIISNLNNGSIDSEFAQLLRKGQSGDGLSLSEAIKQNYLKGNRYFGFIDVSGANTIREPSLNEGYSYTSMQKLRKARIIPVGWELAAEYIYNIGQSQQTPFGCDAKGCTLQNVVDQFDDMGTYYKDGNPEKKVADKYCGWRPISSDPYFLNVYNTRDLCIAFGSVNPMNLKTKWEGKNLGSSGFGGLPEYSNGYCYRYDTDANGNVTGVVDVTNNFSTKNSCRNQQPNETRYYEWKDGGCMVKEKDEADLCGLVDPNWIMKAPAQQCQLEGYYSALEMTQSSNRYQDCVDTVHCLKEDDFGNCIGNYDYCLKEKNIWRFKGDQCSSEFNTCATLVDDKGKTQSYLTNTLKDCPQEEVGCREYIKNKSYSSDSNVWPWNKNLGSLYFNSNIESCDSSNASCNKLVEIKQGANLIPNGSFEIDEDTQGFYGYQKPDGWEFAGSSFVLQDDNNALNGTKSLKHISGTDSLSIEFPATTKGLYTFSYYVKGANGSSVNPTLEVYLEDGSSTIATTENTNITLSDNSQWTRKSGYFLIPVSYIGAVNSQGTVITSENLIVGLKLNISLIGEIYLDAIQFELNDIQKFEIPEGEAIPSSYKEYGDYGAKYIKTAPEYYSCDTNPEAAECLNYAKHCSAQDVGCSAYYPVIDNGVSMIPAIVSDSDKCPSVCNGFDTFSQFPNYFEKLEASQNGFIPPTVDRNFIPESATDCARSEESCELFTNLDKLEQGGESKEYYNRIRQCVKPEEVDSTLYYTWEGSDTEAYQLKTWKILKSNIEDSYSIEDGFAPCTNVEIGGTECIDSVTNIVECDPNIDLDCRTFYDENAVPHNRLLSKTIPITDECIDLRREATEGSNKKIYKIAPSLSRACSEKNVGCTRYEGNNAANVRNLLVENFESGSINGWNVSITSNAYGSYKAPSSESVHYNGQSMKVAITGGTSGTNSNIELTYTDNDKTIIPGKKYILSFWAKAFSDPDHFNDIYIDDYGQGQLSYSIFNKAMAANQTLNFNQSKLVLEKDWTLYEMSVIGDEATISGGSGLILKFGIGVYNSTDKVDGIYIDNITLKEIQSSFYKIKDSWNTPKICLGEDNLDDFNNSIPYLGCQKYNDENNLPVYLYNFSNLCKEENIGCKAMINTYNSDMPFQQTFNAYCVREHVDPDNPATKECNLGKYYYKNNNDVITENIGNSTAIVPKDKTIYIVDNNKYSCSASNKGCSALGVSDDSSTYYDTYLINNPDDYIPNDLYGNSDKQTLCLDEFKNCVAFTKTDNSKIYKIHPRGLECEYRDADQVHNIDAGFYTEDGDECSGLLYNENYDTLSYDLSNAWKPFGEYNYTNQYAAICDSESNGCSHFIDPLDNQNMRDYAENTFADNLDFSNPNEWTQAFWNKDDSSILLSNGAITYELDDPGSDRENILKYTISQSGTYKLNMLAYKYLETDNLYDFFANSGDIYRLSAWVKFNGVVHDYISDITKSRESVITMLNCKSDPSSLDNYFKGPDMPYAFPYLSSKSYVMESEGDTNWHYIYGLYKIIPSANYCNITFYVNGVLDEVVSFDDISFEKVEGNYYYINDDSLDDSCDYPYLKEGCVLFNNTADSNLSWNANESYANNVKVPGNDYIAPDTNRLLKVIRDRECGEWATCGSQMKVFNKRSNQIESSCISLVACDEMSSNTNSCSHFFKRSSDVKPLTLDSYRKDRGSYSWSDMDFSGYSIPGLYPIDALNAVKTSESSEDYSLGHIVVKKSGGDSFVYKLGIGIENFITNSNNLLPTKEKSCRIYPEADSPFPWTYENQMVTDISISGLSLLPPEGPKSYVIPKTKAPNFTNANVCQPNFDFNGNDSKVINSNANCECHYTKAVYGSNTLYYPYDETQIIGGSIPTAIDTPYETNVAIESKTQFLGLKGYCLEYDKSYAINNTKGDNAEYRCLSWYPIETLSGEVDVYSMAESADINQNNIPVGSKICAIADDWIVPEDRIYCGFFGAQGNCNILVKVPAGAKVNMDYYNNHIVEASRIINGINNFGSIDNTWLDNNLYTFEDNPTDVGKDIIRKKDDDIVHMIIDGNKNETIDSESNKFARSYFNNIGMDSDPVKDNYLDSDGFDLMQLFAPGVSGGVLQQFYYDEDVDINNGQNSSSSYFKIDNITATLSGSHCGSCQWSDVEACVNNGGMHEIYNECKKGDHGGWSCIWRNMKRFCNPRNYNYYIAIGTEPVNLIRYVGSCGPNCIFSNPIDERFNNGIGCLRAGIGGYDYYSNMLNDYLWIAISTDGTEIRSFDLNQCKNDAPFGINHDKVIADCDFANCMENSGVNESYNHLCSDYQDAGGSCFRFLKNDEGTFLGSYDMKLAYNKCIVGGSIYGDGPQYTMTDPEADCCVDYSFYNADTCVSYNCIQIHNDSCCTDDDNNPICTAVTIPLYVPPASYYCNPGSTCVQSCLSYFDLNDVVFDANKFYLSKENITETSKQEDCNVGGVSICANVRTSDLSQYTTVKNVSYDKIFQTANSFVSVQSPFSALFSDQANDFALKVENDPQSSPYDFYSNVLDANVNNFVSAKNSLNNIVIRVPDDNFQYKDNSGFWLSVSQASSSNLPTVLSGLVNTVDDYDYWDFTNDTNPPVVKSVEYFPADGVVVEGENGISVNNTHGINIKSNAGSLYANLSFYTYTSSGREPIKQIKINWEDGIETILEGPFKNRKHDCDRKCGSNYNDAFLDGEEGSDCYDNQDCGSDRCFGRTWGDTQEACMEDNKNKNEVGYFSYSYIYTCEPLIDSWESNCSQYGIPGGCCVFTPSVEIMDNWGTIKNANLGNCSGGTCSIIITPR